MNTSNGVSAGAQENFNKFATLSDGGSGQKTMDSGMDVAEFKAFVARYNKTNPEYQISDEEAEILFEENANGDAVLSAKEFEKAGKDYVSSFQKGDSETSVSQAHDDDSVASDDSMSEDKKTNGQKSSDTKPEPPSSSSTDSSPKTVSGSNESTSAISSPKDENSISTDVYESVTLYDSEGNSKKITSLDDALEQVKPGDTLILDSVPEAIESTNYSTLTQSEDGTWTGTRYDGDPEQGGQVINITEFDTDPFIESGMVKVNTNELTYLYDRNADSENAEVKPRNSQSTPPPIEGENGAPQAQPQASESTTTSAPADSAASTSQTQSNSDIRNHRDSFLAWASGPDGLLKDGKPMTKAQAWSLWDEKTNEKTGSIVGDDLVAEENILTDVGADQFIDEVLAEDGITLRNTGNEEATKPTATAPGFDEPVGSSNAGQPPGFDEPIDATEDSSSDTNMESAPNSMATEQNSAADSDFAVAPQSISSTNYSSVTLLDSQAVGQPISSLQDAIDGAKSGSIIITEAKGEEGYKVYTKQDNGDWSTKTFEGKPKEGDARTKEPTAETFSTDLIVNSQGQFEGMGETDTIPVAADTDDSGGGLFSSDPLAVYVGE